MATGSTPDPADDLVEVQRQMLALERERQERSERRMKELRHGLAALLIVGLVLVLFIAWASTR